jgi:hypothetical protein
LKNTFQAILLGMFLWIFLDSDKIKQNTIMGIERLTTLAFSIYTNKGAYAHSYQLNFLTNRL